MTKKICVDCGYLTTHYGRDRCRKCYNSWYRSLPGRREAHAKRMRKYRKEAPEVYAQIERKRSTTEKRLAWRKKYSREYYVKNAEHLKEYQRNWRKANPLKRDEIKRKYRSRKKGLPTTLTEEEWEKILFENNCICVYCGSSENLIKEHWIPVSKGGSYTADNIVPACARCNSRKGDMTGEEYMERLDQEEWFIVETLIDDHQSSHASSRQ